jgi:Biotin protein ligase C terminal domain
LRLFILRSDSGRPDSVIVRTEDGEVRVLWRGATRPPTGETNVELTLAEGLRWGTEVSSAPTGRPTGIGRDGSIVGAVVGLDADGVLKLRVADGLLMIAPTGTWPPLKVGDLIQIYGEISVYPEEV